MIFKFVVLAVFFIGANCRYILVEVDDAPSYYVEEPSDTDANEFNESEHPRVRRGAQSVLTMTSDGKTQLSGKVPLVSNDENIISAIRSISSANDESFGLALDNVNGHQLSISKSTIPDFGEQLTAAGKLNLVHTPNHDVNANAFITRNMPKFPEVPNFNTVGGGLDYTYKDTIGASLGVAKTDLLKRTDVSAMGNLNLWRNPSSFIDFSAGAERSYSPFIPNSSWEPKFLLSFSRSWRYFAGFHDKIPNLYGIMQYEHRPPSHICTCRRVTSKQTSKPKYTTQTFYARFTTTPEHLQEM